MNDLQRSHRREEGDPQENKKFIFTFYPRFFAVYQQHKLNESTQQPLLLIVFKVGATEAMEEAT